MNDQHELKALKSDKQQKITKYFKSPWKNSRSLQNLKAKLKKKELKLKRKRIFNPQEHEDHKLKKIKICEQLKEIREIHGEKIEKIEEPKKSQCLWDYVLKEMAK